MADDPVETTVSVTAIPRSVRRRPRPATARTTRGFSHRDSKKREAEVMADLPENARVVSVTAIPRSVRRNWRGRYFPLNLSFQSPRFQEA